MSTLVDKIVQALRTDIYGGQLGSGHQLKQVELANRYGVSPIPLREALQRLQVEGLVEYFPYRGAVVARMSKGEAADIADIRNALEVLAFRVALPTLDDSQLAELERITDALDSPRAAVDADFFMEHILLYYRVLLARSNRPRLLDQIQTNLRRANRYYAELLRRMPGEQFDAAPTRRQYLDALRARDIGLLQQLVERRHAAYVRLMETYLDE